MKQEYKNWVSTKISYSNEYYENFLFKIYVRLRDWIDSNEDLERFIDNKELYQKFKFFVYCEYVLPTTKYDYNDMDIDQEYYEHYNSMYSEDIINLYTYFRDYSKSLNIKLFHNKGDTSYPFIQFIYSVSDYNEPFNEEHTEDIIESEEYY